MVNKCPKCNSILEPEEMMKEINDKGIIGVMGYIEWKCKTCDLDWIEDPKGKPTTDNIIILDKCYIGNKFEYTIPYFTIFTHPEFYIERDIEYLNEKLGKILNKKIRITIEVLEE